MNAPSPVPQATDIKPKQKRLSIIVKVAIALAIVALAVGAWAWWDYAHRDPLAGILTAQVGLLPVS